MRLITAMLALSMMGCDGNVSQDPSVTPDSAALSHPELRNQLLRMGLLDQTVRLGFSVDVATDTAFIRASLAIDSVLTSRLRRIIDQDGWPTRSMVGREAAQAAFLIVQHSPSDAFQRDVLPALEAAAAASEASAADVALLEDRTLTHDGKPQIYGSQFRIVDGELVPYPIQDLARLDERRASAGLVPMAEYVRMLRQTYGGPVRWPPDSAR